MAKRPTPLASLSATQFREAAKGLLRALGPFVAPRYSGTYPRLSFGLNAEAVTAAEYHLYHLWELFDKADLVPVDGPAAAAAADDAFQRFLHDQCLKAAS